MREGILRKAVIQKDYQRWSVYYSVLDDEWEDVRARLERMLAATTPAG